MDINMIQKGKKGVLGTVGGDSSLNRMIKESLIADLALSKNLK